MSHFDDQELTSFFIVDLAILDGSFTNRGYFVVDLCSEDKGRVVLTSRATEYSEGLAQTGLVHIVETEIVGTIQLKCMGRG
jgi:hypothetical protein